MAEIGRMRRISSRSRPPRSRADTMPTTSPPSPITTRWWIRFQRIRFQAASAFSVWATVWTRLVMMSWTRMEPSPHTIGRRQAPRHEPPESGSLGADSWPRARPSRVASSDGSVLQHPEKVAAVVALHLPREPGHVGRGDPAGLVGDLLGARDLQALARLDGLNEIRGLEERLVRARVEPRHAAAEELDVEVSDFEIRPVDVRDLELAARRGFQRRRDVEHAVVVEIQAGDGIARARLLRLLLEADRVPLPVELYDAVTPGVEHAVGEDGRAGRTGGRALEHLRQAVPVEQVVAERERDGVLAHERTTDEKRLRETLGLRLRRIGDPDAELPAVAEKAHEAGLILGRRDDEDVAQAREHERRERVIDNGLVVDGAELLRDRERERIEARARAAREYAGFHARSRPARGAASPSRSRL